MSKPLRMFIPLTKVDAENRTVYGVATGETPDRSGEICDYATTKPMYEKWSDTIQKASGGKSLGNLRSMHGTVAAGKVEKMFFNDENKQIEICAKIIDDNEWKKVQEGVYTGFSQGGSYAKRWKDGDMTRYTADPTEVSLVDLPCLPDATFQLVKAAGSVTEKHFKEEVQVSMPTNEQVSTKATELAKAAGDENKWVEYIGPARDELMKTLLPPPPEAKETKEATPAEPSDELRQVWEAKDGRTFSKKADAVAYNEALANPAAKEALETLTKLSERLGMEREPAKTTEADDKVPAIVYKDGIEKDLKKDLYSASRFASMLAELQSFQKSDEYRRFTGDLPDDGFSPALGNWVNKGCSLLVAMVESAAGQIGDIDEPAVLAAGAGMLQSAKDAMSKVAGDVKKLEPLSKAVAKIEVKTEENADLAKALKTMTEDRDANKAAHESLNKVVSDQILPALGKISARVEEIAKQPAALPFLGKSRVINKGGEDDEHDAADLKVQMEKMKKEDPDGYAMLMIRVAQSNGMTMHPSS